jgi:hypothetical protein
MNDLESFYILSLSVQVIHSIEELSTGFHKRWYLFKMPFWAFLVFEICFSGFWIVVLMNPIFPYRSTLQLFFLLLMFANGIQHFVWWGNVKKYVPGLLTAPIHIIIAIIYFLGLN